MKPKAQEEFKPFSEILFNDKEDAEEQNKNESALNASEPAAGAPLSVATVQQNPYVSNLKVEKPETDNNKIVDMRLYVPGKDLFVTKQADTFEDATSQCVCTRPTLPPS